MSAIRDKVAAKKPTARAARRVARLAPYAVYLTALILGSIYDPQFTLAALQMTVVVLVIALVVSPIGFFVQRRILSPLGALVTRWFLRWREARRG